MTKSLFVGLTMAFLLALVFGPNAKKMKASQAPSLPPACRGKRVAVYDIPRDNPSEIRHVIGANGVIVCHPSSRVGCHLELINNDVKKDLKPKESMGVSKPDTFILRCPNGALRCAITVCD
jgi:hypothetical protein